MHASDSQGQRIIPPAETVFSALLNALQQKSIAVGRNSQHANTIYINPKTAGEVMDVVKLCGRTHTPISVCYGRADTVDSQPKVYLDLQQLDTIEPLSASRYLVGLGVTLEQLNGTALQGLVSDDVLHSHAGQCLGQLLLSQDTLFAQRLARYVVGLMAVLPDGQLWASLDDKQPCASERLLNGLFVMQSRAVLSVLLALELESSADQWPMSGATVAHTGTGPGMQQVISKLKEALDPNRILNVAQPLVRAGDAVGDA